MCAWRADSSPARWQPAHACCREEHVAHNVYEQDWCELAATRRLVVVARAAPEDARIAPKAEADDAVLLVSHVDLPLEPGRGKRSAKDAHEAGAPPAKRPVVMWRELACGHRCATLDGQFIAVTLV